MVLLTTKTNKTILLDKKPKITQFPIFSRLNIPEIIKIAVEVRASEPRMDLSPASIESFYNTDGRLSFSRLNENLISMYFDPEANEDYYIIYGYNKLLCTIKEIFKYQKQIGIKQQVSSIDCRQARIIARSQLIKLEQTPELNEYIIKTKNHAIITEPSLKDEAMHIRSFIRRYGNDVCVYELDLTKPAAITKIINSWHVWNNHFKNNNNDKDGIERVHINAFLNKANELPTRCIVISHAGQIVGFTFFDVYEEYSCAIGHFIKVDYAYNHAFDFMVHALCSKLHTEGIKYINIENDLGIAGIRYKKQSLLPVKILKFYTATPKK